MDMDPMDVRLKNAAREGTRRPNGTVLPVNGNIEVMEAVKASPHYRSELTGANRGRGVAMGFWNANAGAHSSGMARPIRGRMHARTYLWVLRRLDCFRANVPRM